jgi:hypothetical protein
MGNQAVTHTPANQYSSFVQAFEGATPPDAASPLTIKRVKILGLESRWGRKFTEACLKDAYTRGIYEGLTIYKDHPNVDYSDPNWRKKPLPPRSVNDVLGSIANVTYVEGQGLFGDSIFTVDSELTRSVCLSAKTNPRQYGFSHHAAYDNVSYEGKTEIVGSIAAAFSVDLVTKPATTNGLFEGDNAVSKTATKPAKTPVKPTGDDTEQLTVRQALEAVCKLPIAAKVVQGLEGDFMDAPVTAITEDMPETDQINLAFESAATFIFKSSDDAKTKQSKIDKIFKAQAVLSGTESEPVTTPVTTGKTGLEGDAAKPIGITEALNLLGKHKLPITQIALESYAMMPAGVAEAQAGREVARERENEDLRKKLALATNQKPQSIPRIGLEGGATPKIDKAQQDELDKKPWLSFSRN